MMNNELTAVVSDRLKKLPPNVIKALASLPWQEKITQIAKSNNLNSELSIKLANETTIILLGIESPQKYPENLKRELGLDDKRSLKILLEIGKQIFDPFQSLINKPNTPKVRSSNFDRTSLNQERLDSQLKTLPTSKQRSIALTNWKSLINEIAKDNNLTPEQAENLETEAMLVMYGFVSGDDLQNNIARELSIDAGRAKMLYQEVNLKVFSIVLAKAEQLSKEKDTLQTAAPVAPPPPPTPEPAKVFEPKPTPENPPINVLPPKPKLEPLELLPPKVEGEKATSIEAPKKPSNASYPDGIDPYREPVN